MAFPDPLGAVSLGELLSDESLTPKKFATFFSDFAYDFHEDLRDPEVFLASQSGDCDDYALLADMVLRKRGFTTKLVHVRLVGRVAHVVCFVSETHSYLDYNDRSYFFKLTRSSGRVREIAQKVADTFEGNWTSASVITFDRDSKAKTIVQTIVKTDDPDKDPDAAQ